MALTKIFIKNAKHSGKAVGDKHSDGGGLYLHIKAQGKYWRMAYRIHGQQKKLYKLATVSLFHFKQLFVSRSRHQLWFKQ